MMYRQLGVAMMENGWELRHKARLGDSHPTEAGIDWLGTLTLLSLSQTQQLALCPLWEKELLSRSGKPGFLCHILCIPRGR